MISKETVLEGTLNIYKRKGIKFTMDELAKDLQVSKKTIYYLFDTKEKLFLKLVDYIFASIKESEQKIMEDDSLDTITKIKKIMSVMPEKYQDIDFSKLHILMKRYPVIYKKVVTYLETGWEMTFELLEKGKKEGVIRDVNLELVKHMMEASLEQFFQKDVLVRNNITYNQGLEEVVNILIDGISK